MELIYKSNDVDILFDPEKNILVQKWKEKIDLEEIDLDYFSYTLDEMIKIQLYKNPGVDIEEELKFMLFQSYPLYYAKA